VSLFDVRAFERLLRAGVGDSDIDNFISRLSSTDSAVEQVASAFLRDQIRFLSSLYKNGIYVDHRLGSGIAFIFFTSLLDPLGVAAVRSRLSRIGANCIYLYDDQNLNFALGVRQCGTGAPSTDAVLLKQIREWRVRRVISIGNSAAGFMAVCYAIRLNAYASVTFSPFTTFVGDYELHDGRGKAMIDRIRRLVPDAPLDLVPILMMHALDLVCFYPKENPQDVWQAQRLRDLPQVHLMRATCAAHNVIPALIKDGIFDAFMQLLADGTSVQQAADVCLARFSNPSERDFGRNARNVSV
jgi:hypothetical protein